MFIYRAYKFFKTFNASISGQKFEAIVISWIVILSTIFSIYEIVSSGGPSNGEIVNYFSSSVVPATTQKIQPDSDGRRSFREPEGFGKEGNNIGYIAVYSSPLEAPFASSTPSIRGYFQRQFFSIDYHAFIVARTKYGRWWAVDKMRDGVYVSYGDSRDSVLFFFDQKPRPRPLKLLIEDGGNTVNEYGFLHAIFNRPDITFSSYEIVSENCQHYCKELFDKFAFFKWWRYSTLVDITSPLLLLTNVSTSNLRIVSCFCEICFLFAEFRVGVQHFFQFLKSKYFLLAFTLLIALISAVMMMELEELFGWLTSMFARGLSLLLTMELILLGPLSAARKRFTQYCKKWKLSRDFMRVLLPLIFMFVYAQLILRLYVMMISFLGDRILYLVGASAIFSVEGLISDVYDTVSEDYQLIIIYVLSTMYFAFSS